MRLNYAAALAYRIFGWETGETLAEINKQKETNIHNISSWFNQKPRMIVEWWVIIGGLVLPFWRRIRNIRTDASEFSYWFWPTNIVIPTAVVFFFLQCGYWYRKAMEEDIERWMYDSEIREYYVALFLSLYLISICIRLKTRAAHKA